MMWHLELAYLYENQSKKNNEKVLQQNQLKKIYGIQFSYYNSVIIRYNSIWISYKRFKYATNKSPK